MNSILELFLVTLQASCKPPSYNRVGDDIMMLYIDLVTFVVLFPVVGVDGLLRVGGRVKNAVSLDYDGIVPHKSPIAVLIAREFHNVVLG